MLAAALLLVLALTPPAVTCESPSQPCSVMESSQPAQTAPLSRTSKFYILNSTFSSFAIRYSPFAIASTSRPASLRDDPRAQRWRDTLFWSLILFLILIVASLAIVRFSRRYLAYLRGHKPDAPTASQDVWSMHKLPPDALDPPPAPDSRPPNDAPDND